MTSKEEPSKESKDDEIKTTNKEGVKDGEERWGFGLYPQRRGTYEKSWTDITIGKRGNELTGKLNCEKLVWNVVNKSPLIKLMLDALKSSGCPVDLERHVVCEVCDRSVLGGYDQELNQVVICQNVCKSEGRVQGALAHELVHMFDYCNNKIDFSNLDHLACTEIKAANLTSCSFLTGLSLKPGNIFRIGGSHEDCVKTKAIWSIKYARNVSEEEASEAVDRVFAKCYNDLEPLGRRPRRNSKDFAKAYRERYIYGYG